METIPSRGFLVRNGQRDGPIVTENVVFLCVFWGGEVNSWSTIWRRVREMNDEIFVVIHWYANSCQVRVCSGSESRPPRQFFKSIVKGWRYIILRYFESQWPTSTLFEFLLYVSTCIYVLDVIYIEREILDVILYMYILFAEEPRYNMFELLRDRWAVRFSRIFSPCAHWETKIGFRFLSNLGDLILIKYRKIASRGSCKLSTIHVCVFLDIWILKQKNYPANTILT